MSPKVVAICADGKLLSNTVGWFGKTMLIPVMDPCGFCGKCVMRKFVCRGFAKKQKHALRR